ncbi:Gfo/Idh/MocA family protein [Afifella pfennigii]|uniref:Gfo/Idh/MocA family protein n=1 Tax=Afifella pfennigii TaxID=209897 RepID=UPI00047C6E85|nr:Gfo/Idh/MocA family oxidoreductase [Afifella pfennigii]
MINAAIVGLGGWGQVLVRAIHGKSDKIRISRGVTRTPAKAAEFSAQTGIPVDDDWAGLLADPDIDALLLATPHSMHVAQILEAAEAGKHVFCEKPLALEAKGAADAYDACEKAGVVLALAHNRRFLPAYGEMKRLVGDGRLGRILHMEGNFSGPSGYRHTTSTWRANAAESPAGGMTGKGIHLTDLMIDLLGPPARVEAKSLRQVLEAEMDDTTTMLIDFADGGTGYLGTLTATPDDWRFQVYGSEGWAEIRFQTILTTRFLGEAPQTRQMDASQMEQAALEAFAEAASGGKAFPVTRQQAIANTALLEAIARSAGEGKPQAIDLSAR